MLCLIQIVEFEIFVFRYLRGDVKWVVNVGGSGLGEKFDWRQKCGSSQNVDDI